MARILNYTFPACNTQDVCKTQTLAGAGNLILNGNLANPITGEASFIDNGYSRSISITSNANLIGVNFTINGFQNGVAITQIVTGPNNTTTYYSNLYYDEITSISASGPVANVSIGSGVKGFFSLIKLNLAKDTLVYSLSINAGTGTNIIPTTIYNTYEDISNNGSTFLTNTTNNLALFALKAVGADQQWEIEDSTYAYHSLLIHLDGTSATAASRMTMNFIQL